ncbi:hypothetical protein OSTOST_14523, partial [Ostertagia ostertagi]
YPCVPLRNLILLSTILTLIELISRRSLNKNPYKTRSNTGSWAQEVQAETTPPPSQPAVDTAAKDKKEQKRLEADISTAIENLSVEKKKTTEEAMDTSEVVQERRSLVHDVNPSDWEPARASDAPAGPLEVTWDTMEYDRRKPWATYPHGPLRVNPAPTSLMKKPDVEPYTVEELTARQFRTVFDYITTNNILRDRVRASLFQTKRRHQRVPQTTKIVQHTTQSFHNLAVILVRRQPLEIRFTHLMVG